MELRETRTTAGTPRIAGGLIQGLGPVDIPRAAAPRLPEVREVAAGGRFAAPAGPPIQLARSFGATRFDRTAGVEATEPVAPERISSLAPTSERIGDVVSIRHLVAATERHGAQIRASAGESRLAGTLVPFERAVVFFGPVDGAAEGIATLPVAGVARLAVDLAGTVRFRLLAPPVGEEFGEQVAGGMHTPAAAPAQILAAALRVRREARTGDVQPAEFVASRRTVGLAEPLEEPSSPTRSSAAARSVDKQQCQVVAGIQYVSVAGALVEAPDAPKLPLSPGLALQQRAEYETRPRIAVATGTLDQLATPLSVATAPDPALEHSTEFSTTHGTSIFTGLREDAPRLLPVLSLLRLSPALDPRRDAVRCVFVGTVGAVLGRRHRGAPRPRHREEHPHQPPPLFRRCEQSLHRVDSRSSYTSSTASSLTVRWMCDEVELFARRPDLSSRECNRRVSSANRSRVSRNGQAAMVDHPSTPDDEPPPKATQEELEFEDPAYLDADELEPIERDLADERRRMSRSDRRAVKKAAKMARYPVERCVIATDWDDQRFGPVAMVRTRPDDHIAFGSSIIDLGGLGLKSGFVEFSMTSSRADEMIERVQELGADLEECEPKLASKVLRHAVAFAAKCGIDPPHEYFALRKFFGDHDLSEVEGDVPLGHRGKPVLIPGPEDDVEELAAQFEEELGRNGFYLGAPNSGPARADKSEESSARAGEGAGERAHAPTPPDLDADDTGDDDSESDILMPGDF